MKFALGNLKINDAIKTAALSALFAANLHTTLLGHAFGEAFLDRCSDKHKLSGWRRALGPLLAADAVDSRRGQGRGR